METGGWAELPTDSWHSWSDCATSGLHLCDHRVGDERLQHDPKGRSHKLNEG